MVHNIVTSMVLTPIEVRIDLQQLIAPVAKRVTAKPLLLSRMWVVVQVVYWCGYCGCDFFLCGGE